VATFTIEIPDAHLPKLQAAVDQDNGNNGTAYTVQQWIEQAVKQRMIQEELQLAFQQLQQQKNADFAAAVATARARRLYRPATTPVDQSTVTGP